MSKWRMKLSLAVPLWKQENACFKMELMAELSFICCLSKYSAFRNPKLINFKSTLTICLFKLPQK